MERIFSHSRPYALPAPDTAILGRLREQLMVRSYPRVRQVCGTGIYAMTHPPSVIPAHAHTQPRFSFILQGNTVEIDDRRRKTPSGPLTMVYQPPGWKHAHVVETESSYMCFDLSPQLIDRFSALASDLECPMLLGAAPVVDAALRVHKEMWAEDSASPLVLEALIVELVGECTRQPRLQVHRTPPRWLRQAHELVEDRFRDHLTLDEIGGNVGIHPSHLSRMFRAYYGETVGEFSRRLRLEEGVRQIVATRLAIGEIAANAGFSDNAHFSRECRRVMGATPLEIRRSL